MPAHVAHERDTCVVIGRPLVLAACLAALVGCVSNGSGSTASIIPVSLPDLSGADAAAQAQIRDRYQELTRLSADPLVTPGDLGAAYGDMGTLLMAAELNGAAESCFLNATTLAKGDFRWTYYLAHLYRRKGDLGIAEAYFKRTLDAQPDDGAALWWLGTVYLEQGRPVDAEAPFSRALMLRPGALSAVYGLGMAALAKDEYVNAVEYFERVLSMNPKATAAHYPLGLAYRGAGRLEQAQAHLDQRSSVAIVPIDPLMDELDELLRFHTAYMDRGMRAARSGNWADAAAEFGKAVEVAPDDVTARIDLSNALARIGDLDGALVHARRAVALAPGDRRASDVLAALVSVAESGRTR